MRIRSDTFNRRMVLASLIAMPMSGLAAARGLRAEVGTARRCLAFDGDTLIHGGRTLAASGDGGKSWTEHQAPGAITALASHPARPGRIVAGLVAGGVVVSEDSGETWHVRSSGLPGGEIGAVAIAALDPDLIYAAIRGDGLWKSGDSGRSWSLAMDRPWLDGAERDPLSLASVALETGMGGIWIYAGTDAGLTRVPDCFCRWQDVQPGNAMDALVSGAAPPPEAPLPRDEPILSLASAASAPGWLYAATTSGVWVSADAGVVWENTVRGAGQSVAVHPRDHRYVAAVIDGTVQLSRDGGVTWTAAAAA